MVIYVIPIFFSNAKNAVVKVLEYHQCSAYCIQTHYQLSRQKVQEMKCGYWIKYKSASCKAVGCLACRSSRLTNSCIWVWNVLFFIAMTLFVLTISSEDNIPVGMQSSVPNVITKRSVELAPPYTFEIMGRTGILMGFSAAKKTSISYNLQLCLSPFFKAGNRKLQFIFP